MAPQVFEGHGALRPAGHAEGHGRLRPREAHEWVDRAMGRMW